jgi:hypothetical protein
MAPSWFIIRVSSRIVIDVISGKPAGPFFVPKKDGWQEPFRREVINSRIRGNRMTTAAGVRLGLKVWIAVGGPVFATALMVMGWDVAHLKLQAAPRPDAQSAVAGTAATPSAARLSPPWEKNTSPAYPVGVVPLKVSSFSYDAPYKEILDLPAEVIRNASYKDALLMRPNPTPAPRGRHRRR